MGDGDASQTAATHMHLFFYFLTRPGKGKIIQGNGTNNVKLNKYLYNGWMKGAHRRTVVFYGGARAVGDRPRGGLATNLVLRHAREANFFFFTRCDSYEVLQLAKRHSPFHPPPPSPLRPHFHNLGFSFHFQSIVNIFFFFKIKFISFRSSTCVLFIAERTSGTE